MNGFKKITASALILMGGLVFSSVGTFAAELTETDGKIYLEDSGKYLTGWQTYGGNKYYFQKDGSAVTKSRSIGGVRYKFGSNGVCRGEYTGWTKSKSGRYYYINGIKQTGWFWRPETNEPNEWFYFNEKDGSLASGTVIIDGREYEFSSEGVWQGSNEIDVSSCYSRLNKKLSEKDIGGIYSKNGGLVVMTVNEENVKKVTDGMKEKCAQITLMPCKFSAAELENVMDHIWKNRAAYGVAAISTDVINNRIEVEMPKDNRKFSSYINSLDDSDIVHIVYGDGKIIED